MSVVAAGVRRDSMAMGIKLQMSETELQKMRDQIAAAEVRLIEQQEGMPQRMGHLSFIFRALIPHDLPCSDPQ